MKKLISLLIFVFALQSCENKTENKESTELQSIELDKSIKMDTVQNSIQQMEKGNDFSEIEGLYIFEDELANCKITLILFSENGILKYKMKTNTKEYSDIAEISKEENGNFITFKNIEWSEYLGALDSEGEPIHKNLEVPTDIEGGFDENGIMIQNAGNSMNYYSKIGDCGVKYIDLVKQTNIQLGEDRSEINAYAKDIYKKNGKIYIDLDFVEIRYPTKGEWDVSDREIINNNPQIRTYIIDENSGILSNICKELTASELFEIRESLLKNKSIIVIGNSKNGKILGINFGCYG